MQLEQINLVSVTEFFFWECVIICLIMGVPVLDAQYVSTDMWREAPGSGTPI